MSQTQPTQDTKSNTSSVLRRRGRPSKTETTLATSSEEKPEVVEAPIVKEVIEDKTPTIDLESLYVKTEKSQKEIQDEIEFFNKMKKLDFAVDYANKNKIEWLEVDQDILEYFYRGTIPEVGYYIYKNTKLCLAGQAKSLAARDNLTCHEVLFPKENYMKLGVKRG